MFSLLSNMALLKKFLSFVGLIPMILKFIEVAEATGQPGTVKRKQVVDTTTVTIKELAKRGYIPEELTDGLSKTVEELTDIAVGVYNTVGYFEHAKDGDRPKLTRPMDVHTKETKK